VVHFLHSFCRRTPRRWRRGVLSDFCDVTSPPQAIPPVKAPQGNPAPTGPAAGSFQPRLNGNHHRNFVSMWLTVPIHKRNLPLTSVCHKAGTTVQAVLEAANLPPNRMRKLLHQRAMCTQSQGALDCAALSISSEY
jgi:hypothetical protein